MVDQRIDGVNQWVPWGGHAYQLGRPCTAVPAVVCPDLFRASTNAAADTWWLDWL